MGCGFFRLTWCLQPLLLLIGMDFGASAEPSGPSLKIDDNSLPVVAFEAKNVPAIEVLNQLAALLHVEVEYVTPVDKSPAITGSFKGEFGEILGRVLLPNAGYVAWWRGSAIDHIVVTASGGAALSAAAAPSPSAAALDAMPVPVTTVTKTSRADTAQQREIPVSNLLQTQANMMERAATNAGAVAGSNRPVSAASSRSTMQSSTPSVGTTQTSLAAMTSTAQANVRMLAKALNAVCIGANCPQ
jgi:hypothetical protein